MCSHFGLCIPYCASVEMTSERKTSRHHSCERWCVDICAFACVCLLEPSPSSPDCALLCFSLAVEPFNPQPQLHYLALSRSYKGSFSAWCFALATSVLLISDGSMHSRVIPFSGFPFGNTHLACFKVAEVLTVGSLWKLFPTTCDSWVGNL